MKNFDKLVDEAKQTRDNINDKFNEVYYAGQDTTRLQAAFNKATDRLIRRQSCVWLLERAKEL